MQRALRLSSLAALLFSAPVLASAAPSVTLEPTAVVASGVTAGQSVLFFGLTRAEKRYNAVYATHREILRDEDGDGVVRFEPEAGVPWKSVFFAVDLGNGELAVASPEGFPLTEAPLAAEDVRRGPSGDLDRLHIADRRAEVTVVRLGTGAWGGEVYDGAPADRDAGLYDEMEVDLTDLAALESSPAALESLAGSDLILVIHPEYVLHSFYRVPEVEP